MRSVKGEAVFLSASIDTLLERILSSKHRASDVDSLTAAQSRLLFLLWMKDEIPIREVSRITHLQKSTLTNTLSKLEQAGHIQLVSCETDRRQTIVKVTNRDGSLVALNKRLIDETGEIFYKGFDESEIALYESFLKRTLVNLKETLE